jgi:hypothetical protein
VGACGSGPWGEIPVDGATQHVDGSYAGADSDGSAARPWPTIQQGIDAAAPGATVAVAAGSYLEDVSIQGKAVRLWGKCPDEVELRGTGGFGTAVFIREGASGTELHDLAITGPAWGIAVSGAEDVLFERVWVHDTDRGLDAESFVGPTSLTLRGVLVERATDLGVLAAGVRMTIEDSVIRDTAPDPSGATGYGLTAQNDVDTGARVEVDVRRSIIERNAVLGVLLWGAVARLDGALVRDTLPQVSSGLEGRGIGMEDDYLHGPRAEVTVTSSVVERNPEFGIFAAGSDLTIEATTIRDTLPEQATQRFGRCLSVQDDDTTGQPARLTMRESLVERCHDVGMTVAGGAMIVESILVRDVQPIADDQKRGRGINVQPSVTGSPRGTGVIRWSVVERAHEMGILVVDSDAVIDVSRFSETRARPLDGAFGDGIAVMNQGVGSAAAISGCRVEDSARAGISSFAASIQLAATDLGCNPIHLAGEPFGGRDYAFQDEGANSCGCLDEQISCRVLTENLAPPEPIAESP